MESLNTIIMSHFDQLPHELQNHIGQYIPYRRPPQQYQTEYKIFCQDWKNQTQAKQWTGIDPNLYFDQDEVIFLNKAFFKHQLLKRFYNISYCLEKGIMWERKYYHIKNRRNTI